MIPASRVLLPPRRAERAHDAEVGDDVDQFAIHAGGLLGDTRRCNGVPRRAR